MRAYCLGSTVPYVPQCDAALPEAERTTFRLRVLSVRQKHAITTPEPGELARAWWARVVAAGLDGWTNYRRADGTDVPFVRQEGAAPLDQPYLDLLDDDQLEELALAVFAAQSPSRADGGKSSTSSGSASAGTAPSATPA